MAQRIKNLTAWARQKTKQGEETQESRDTNIHICIKHSSTKIDKMGVLRVLAQEISLRQEGSVFFVVFRCLTRRLLDSWWTT